MEDDALALLVLANIDADVVDLAATLLASGPEERIAGLDLRKLDVLALLQVVLSLGIMGKLRFGDLADGVKDESCQIIISFCSLAGRVSIIRDAEVGTYQSSRSRPSWVRSSRRHPRHTSCRATSRQP